MFVWIFFRLLYAIAKIAIITARIILHLISYPQFTYDLFHMHQSPTYLSREHMNPKLTCSQRQWLHSSVGRASHRYREVTGSSPVEVLNFFQASLRNCKNCDHNCEDHSSFDVCMNTCFFGIKFILSACTYILPVLEDVPKKLINIWEIAELKQKLPFLFAQRQKQVTRANLGAARVQPFSWW